MTHFLDTPQSAYAWAVKNLPDFLTYDEAVKEFGEDSSEAQEAKWDEDLYAERSYLYSYKYQEVKSLPSVKIYRVINVHDVGDIRWNEIGLYWSFERSCAGSYGCTSGGRDVLVVGEVDPKYIDWQHGFESFLWYGESQWEAALKSGVPVRIVEIDREPIKRAAVTSENKRKAS